MAPGTLPLPPPLQPAGLSVVPIPCSGSLGSGVPRSDTKSSKLSLSVPSPPPQVLAASQALTLWRWSVGGLRADSICFASLFPRRGSRTGCSKFAADVAATELRTPSFEGRRSDAPRSVDSEDQRIRSGQTLCSRPPSHCPQVSS